MERKKDFESLIKGLKDEEEDVRWFAAEALVQIGDERALEFLTKALDDKSKIVRVFAKNALEEIKSKKS